MKLDWNPLDIKPAGELTLYGDARPLEPFRQDDKVSVNGTPYRVLDVTDDGDSVTYKLEAEPAHHGTVILEWPPPGPSPYAVMLGRQVAIFDAVTGKQVTTCSAVNVRADIDDLVAADLTLFADENGNPLLEGPPVVKDGEFLTGVFPFYVAEMRVRS